MKNRVFEVMRNLQLFAEGEGAGAGSEEQGRLGGRRRRKTDQGICTPRVKRIRQIPRAQHEERMARLG